MKKNILQFTYTVCLGFALILINSCKKDFLNAVPDKSILIPTTLTDFQAILDNTSVMNLAPEIGLIASDEYYISANGLAGLYTATEKNSYSWAQNVYNGEAVSDWNVPYQQVFYCNVVLDGLATYKDKSITAYKSVEGSALFYRGIAYYNLSQVFAAPYDSTAAANLMGIPVRNGSDVNVKSVRGTLQETYAQILSDIKSSIPLLPLTATYKSRPNKAAGYALLARVYLSMGKYTQAGAYADSSLQLNNKLNDYSIYNPADYRPFPLVLPNNNDEVDFDTSPLPYSFDESSLAFVDSTLYKSFSDNDNRKSLFFTDQGNGGINFQGSYSGTYLLFEGLTTDEMYLIRAEANARAGNVTSSMKDLNTLLVTRFKQGLYTPYSATTADQALGIILSERRKELFSRGLRWSDLRRLNTDPRFAKTLTKIISGQIYTLMPNDKKYVFPIPDEEISGSGIPQNPR